MCTLTSSSQLFLQTAALPLPLLPTGTFSISCGAKGADGTAACSCELMQFGPVVIPAIGDVCVNPASGCSPGIIDCDGGSSLGVDLDANHNIAACTGDAQCAASCDAYCGAKGAKYTRQSYGCEGYCQGGSNAGGTCDYDSDCPGLVSRKGPHHPPGRLQLRVLGKDLGAAGGAGGLSCNLGTQINVELPSSGVCGDKPATIQLAPVCTAVTTQTSSGVVKNANDTAGATRPRPRRIRCRRWSRGNAVSCDSFRPTTPPPSPA
ncbi:MAG: hypothetical protein U0802_10130 [Candidatus Binatia bacterium]